MEKRDSASYLLTDSDIKQLAGPDSTVMSYPDLYEYKNIESLMRERGPKVLILYLTDKNEKERSLTGHWVVLTPGSRDSGVCFFDSYAYMPDSELNFNKSKAKRIFLNQDKKYLTQLLYDYSRRGGVVEYNEMKFQERGDGVATCGRHAGLRAKFYHIPLPEYQMMWRPIKDKDQAAVFISNEILDW